MAGEAPGLSPSAPSATTAVSPASALARDADPRRRRAVAGVAEERRLGCARTARLENAETSCRARGEELRRRCGTVTRLVSGVTRSIEPRVGSSDVTTTIGEREEKSLQIRRSGQISFKAIRETPGLVCAPVKDATLRTKSQQRRGGIKKFFFYTVDAFETQHLSNTR
jgi:hypothetical protein